MKIWRMHLSYPDGEKIKIDYPKSKYNHQDQYKKARGNEEERRSLMRLHPNHTDYWQDALLYTGARCEGFRGQKIYMINGKPTTMFKIMALYDNRPLHDNHPAMTADDQSDQPNE